MPIAFTCACGKNLRAKDELAGKKSKCPGCGSILIIPPPERAPVDEDDVAAYLLEPGQAPAGGGLLQKTTPDPDREPRVSHFTPSPRKQESEGETRPARPAARAGRDAPPSGASIREYSYWLLLFALVPLVFSLLGGESPSVGERLQATIEAATPEQAKKIEAALAKGEQLTMDELFEALPGGKFADAHLPQSTIVHWVYGGVATTGFLLLILLMFSVERSHPLHLLGVGLFTGTVGILFLLAVQFCSQLRFRTIRTRGVGAVILLILMFVGWSYRSALDEDSEFLLSAIGFTFGVGLCEELTKAIPLLFYFRFNPEMGWRGACLWGLASGIGFGVSEGIMYSADSYNGISGPGIYVVRFISCVALHAMWSASVGITIARSLGSLQGVEDLAGFGLFILRVLAVPMVLHGFYDTLLKTDQNVWALVVALASFAWFALQIERARAAMPEAGLGMPKRRFA